MPSDRIESRQYQSDSRVSRTLWPTLRSRALVRLVLAIVSLLLPASARATDLEAYISGFWTDAWQSDFSPGQSGISLSDGGEARTIEAVDTRFGTVGSGTYIEISRLPADLLEFSQEDMDELGLVDVQVSVVAAWISTSGGLSTHVVGLYQEVVLPDYPPGEGQKKLIALVPLSDHQDQ